MADGSELCRRLTERLLRQMAVQISGARNVVEAQSMIERASGPDLLLVDQELPGGGAQELLRWLQCVDGPHPYVVVLGRDPDPDWETEASIAGAIACLRKPLTLNALRRVVWSLREPDAAKEGVTIAVRTEFESPFWATIVDELGRPALESEIRNMSRTGALLLTDAAIDVGERLRLRLRGRSREREIEAVVVRVQPPEWGRLGGVGIVFPGEDGPAAAEL